jgi:hypothetical protein
VILLDPSIGGRRGRTAASYRKRANIEKNGTCRRSVGVLSPLVSTQFVSYFNDNFLSHCDAINIVKASQLIHCSCVSTKYLADGEEKDESTYNTLIVVH